MAYTNNVPQANQPISTTQGPILANFAFIPNAIGQEHNFNASDGTQTYHLKASMPNMTDPTSLPSGTNGIYYVNNGGARFFDGTTICRFSEGASNTTNGYQWMGKILVQWGQINGLTGKWPTTPQTYTFTSPNINFPTGVFAVLTTFLGPSSSSSGDITIQGVSKSNFIWQFSGSSTASYNGFYWLAIGN